MLQKNAKDGPKKLVIKPFKSQPKLPENYEEITWTKLKAAVQAVHRKTAIEISKEELYRVKIDFGVKIKKKPIYLI